MNNDLDNYLLKFINAYNNYELELENLLQLFVLYYNNIKNEKYDNADQIYDNIMELIVKYELDGTTDLLEPINDIYNDFICKNWDNTLKKWI